jgi:hypothetical protein
MLNKVIYSTKKAEGKVIVRRKIIYINSLLAKQVIITFLTIIITHKIKLNPKRISNIIRCACSSAQGNWSEKQYSMSQEQKDMIKIPKALFNQLTTLLARVD